MAWLIQVGNLSVSVDSLGLQRLFEAHGVVRSSMIAKHLEADHSTGVGFIEMESDESGTAAIAALNHREHDGRVLSVCWNESAKNPAAVSQQMFGPMNMMGDEISEKERHQQ
jgi:RNA recognition motif-containing protein